MRYKDIDTLTKFVLYVPKGYWLSKKLAEWKWQAYGYGCTEVALTQEETNRLIEGGRKRLSMLDENTYEAFQTIRLLYMLEHGGNE